MIPASENHLRHDMIGGLVSRYNPRSTSRCWLFCLSSLSSSSCSVIKPVLSLLKSPPQFSIPIQCSASVVSQTCLWRYFIASCQHACISVLSGYHAATFMNIIAMYSQFIQQSTLGFYSNVLPGYTAVYPRFL